MNSIIVSETCTAPQVPIHVAFSPRTCPPPFSRQLQLCKAFSHQPLEKRSLCCYSFTPPHPPPPSRQWPRGLGVLFQACRGTRKAGAAAACLTAGLATLGHGSHGQAKGGGGGVGGDLDVAPSPCPGIQWNHRSLEEMSLLQPPTEMLLS